MSNLSSVKNGSKDVRGDIQLKLSEYVHHIRMDDQVILADMRSGHYLGLDGVGARVWDLVSDGATFGAVIECLSAEYEVSQDVLERDIKTLLDDLRRRGLVRVESVT